MNHGIIEPINARVLRFRCSAAVVNKSVITHRGVKQRTAVRTQFLWKYVCELCLVSAVDQSAYVVVHHMTSGGEAGMAA